MRAEIADLDWPPDLLDDEEQDEPLAGQDHHDTIDSLHYPLRAHLSGPDCFVAAELRVHRSRQNLRDFREPDILVAFGVPDRVRPRYLIWQEGKAPDLVIEVLSPSSLENGDLHDKRDWYRREGVREYVVLDPSGDFAPEPRLQAWRFGDQADGSADVYRTVAADGTLWSDLIPFGWRVVDDWVRAVDRKNGAVFPPVWEVEGHLRAEVRARQEVQERARLAEEQALQAQLEARLARLEARQAFEEARVAQEQQRLARLQVQMAEERERQAEERAEREAAARRAQEGELARLRRGDG